MSDETTNAALRGSGTTDRVATDRVIVAFGLEGQLKRHFGSDQSVWRDGDWNGFVRIALAVLLAPLIELAQSVGHLVPKRSR